MKWADTPNIPWSRHETEEGQVVIIITVTREDFICFYEDVDMTDLKLEISFKEKISDIILEGECYVKEPNSTHDTRKTERIPNIIDSSYSIVAVNPVISTKESTKTNNIRTRTITNTSITTTTTTLITSTTSTTTTTITTTTTTTASEQPLKGSVTKSRIIERWRDYEVMMIITDPKSGSPVPKVVQYDTYEWQCEDPARNVISQKEFCNNIPDCDITDEYPNGRDEDPGVCRVSELPKNLGYLVYLVMMIVVVVYFSRKNSETNNISELIKSTALNVNIVLPNQFNILESRGRTKIFFLEYHSIPNSAKMSSFCQYMKLWYYNQADIEKEVNVFSCIRLAEERLHDNAEERYLCILKNYGGDATVTERICCPEGTLLVKLKQSCQKLFNLICSFLFGKPSSPIPWFVLDIVFGFICLCSHLFDYIKDIGKAVNIDILSFSLMLI